MSSPFQVNFQKMPEVYNTIETPKGVFVVVTPNNQSTINNFIEVGKKRKWPFQELQTTSHNYKKTRYN
jgi:hypothetical protein